MVTEQLVVVVDDDPAIRDSVQALMKSVGLPLVGYSSATEFLNRQDLDKVGCLILDVRLPGMSGLDLLDQVRSRGTDVPTIVISGYGDIPIAVRAIKAGALDFLEKPYNQQTLLDLVHQGLQENARRRELHGNRAEFQARLGLLTPREHGVLEMLVGGKSNTEIAEDLGISRKTLDIHRAKVLHKMQADNVPTLVSLVWQFAPFKPAHAELATRGKRRERANAKAGASADEKPKRARGRPRKDG